MKTTRNETTPTPAEWAKMLGLKTGQVYFGREIIDGREAAARVRALEAENAKEERQP